MLDNYDEKETKYRSKLKSLYEENGITPCISGYNCASFEKCKNFNKNSGLTLTTGNWMYIGDLYGEATISEVPVKILFVGMDRGGTGETAGEEFSKTQYSFRNATINRPNPHMGGVATILHHLVDEKESYIFSRQFALTNALKCAKQTGKMSTSASNKMKKECRKHLKDEINIMLPDIIIAQGVDPSNTLKNIFQNKTELKDHGITKIYEIKLDNSDKPVLLMTTHHPARQKGFKWRQNILSDHTDLGVNSIKDYF
jgi:hypothetical protein